MPHGVSIKIPNIINTNPMSGNYVDNATFQLISLLKKVNFTYRMIPLMIDSKYQTPISSHLSCDYWFFHLLYDKFKFVCPAYWDLLGSPSFLVRTQHYPPYAFLFC